MAWFYLLLAGLMEVGWAIGLKYTDGFTRFWPLAPPDQSKPATP